jgi:hypothetical protein
MHRGPGPQQQWRKMILFDTSSHDNTTRPGEQDDVAAHRHQESKYKQILKISFVQGSNQYGASGSKLLKTPKLLKHRPKLLKTPKNFFCCKRKLTTSCSFRMIL